MRRVVVFVAVLALLIYYSAPSVAQTEGAAAAGTTTGAGTAGAAGGAAVAGGITTGTIVTGTILAAGLAAAIASSGGGGSSGDFVPTPSTAEQQNTQNLVKNTAPTTQAATSRVSLTLNSIEIANLATASTAVLGKSYGGVTAAQAMSGLTVASLQAQLAGGPGNLTTFLNGLSASGQTAAYNAYVSTLQSIANRGSQNAIDALGSLTTAIQSDPNGAAAVTAVSNVLTDAGTNYAAMMQTMLATLHPGYFAIITPTVHHGGGAFTYVTTLHPKP